MEKRFRLQDLNGHDVMGGELTLENPYIGGGYGALLPAQKRPEELAIDETCRKSFALSGGKPTVYVIVRVK
jgi:hypothetical protein